MEIPLPDTFTIAQLLNLYAQVRVKMILWSSNVIYEGKCEACQEIYIGETTRNFSIRKKEHEEKAIVTKESARHLYANPSQSFTWKILGTCKV